MRQVIEITGTVPADVPIDDDSIVEAVVGNVGLRWAEPDLAWVADRMAAIVRADRRWKLAEPLTLTIVSEADRTYRVHCVLDTEAGDVPVLPGDTADVADIP